MKDLLQRAQYGDGDAFAELFQAHSQELWKTAMSVMRDEHSAADMLQEAAIKAWKSVPRFDGKSRLSTWLTRILLNTCFDELRNRRKVIPFADISDEIEMAEPYASELSNSNGRNEIDYATRLDVRSAMDSLGVNDRLILTLFYACDLPVSEIAEVLGISGGAVRTRLTRARSRFKKIYSKHMEQPYPVMMVAKAKI